MKITIYCLGILKALVRNEIGSSLTLGHEKEMAASGTIAK